MEAKSDTNSLSLLVVMILAVASVPQVSSAQTLQPIPKPLNICLAFDSIAITHDLDPVFEEIVWGTLKDVAFFDFFDKREKSGRLSCQDKNPILEGRLQYRLVSDQTARLTLTFGKDRALGSRDGCEGRLLQTKDTDPGTRSAKATIHDCLIEIFRAELTTIFTSYFPNKVKIKMPCTSSPQGQTCAILALPANRYWFLVDTVVQFGNQTNQFWTANIVGTCGTFDSNIENAISAIRDPKENLSSGLAEVTIAVERTTLRGSEGVPTALCVNRW